MHGIFAQYCWQSDNAKSIAIGVPICCSCGWSLLQNKIEKSVLFEQKNVQTFQVKFSRDFLSLRGSLNPIVPNAPFLYPLKTSENFKVFFCFQGVEKWFWKLYNEISVKTSVFGVAAELKPAIAIENTHIYHMTETFIKGCFRSSHQEVFCKEGPLKNFAKFAGKKHLCRSLFFSKVAGRRPW